MQEFVIIIVIVTSIWVYFDAKSIGVKKGMVTGLANMGPGGWFWACLLLWIISFPIYLAKRGTFKQLAAVEKNQAGSDPDRLAALEKEIAELKKSSGQSAQEQLSSNSPRSI